MHRDRVEGTKGSLPGASGSWGADMWASLRDIFCAAESGCEQLDHIWEHFELTSVSDLRQSNLQETLSRMNIITINAKGFVDI